MFNKKSRTLVGGFILGIFTTIFFIFIFSEFIYQKTNPRGLTIFQKKGECIPVQYRMRVLRVVKPNMALAEAAAEYPGTIIVLLINYNDKTYYDDQIIDLLTNKCVRQIGLYKFNSKSGMDKTVPAVVIE